MPCVTDPNHPHRTPIVRHSPGDSDVVALIEVALELVRQPGYGFAYFDFAGVIVRINKDATMASAYADWEAAVKADLREITG